MGELEKSTAQVGVSADRTEQQSAMHSRNPEFMEKWKEKRCWSKKAKRTFVCGFPKVMNVEKGAVIT